MIQHTNSLLAWLMKICRLKNKINVSNNESKINFSACWGGSLYYERKKLPILIECIQHLFFVDEIVTFISSSTDKC